MAKKLKSKKALYLEPNRRTVPGKKRDKARSDGSQWVEHRSDAALDEWGVAIRALRKSGKLF
jgi:hypothetical protein